MRAAVYFGHNKFDVQEFPLRKLERGEVLVEVNCCGVCGTDYHIVTDEVPSSPPVILGHEFSGKVVDKTSDVLNTSIGDKVAVDPNIYCGQCKYCRKGMVHFCENHQALGVTLDGGFAEYAIVPSTQIYSLPDEIDLSLAAFAEPLSCCMRGIEQAEIKPGESIVIIGGGSIGLMMIQLVKLCGADKIILVEPVDYKRQIASKLGADFTFSPHDQNLVKSILDITGTGADKVIECVGKKEAVELSLSLAGKGGRVVIFGLASINEKVELNLHNLFKNEISIHSSFLNPFTFSSAVNILTSGKIDVSVLVSNKIPLKNIKDIFNKVDNTRTIKNQVTNLNKEE